MTDRQIITCIGCLNQDFIVTLAYDPSEVLELDMRLEFACTKCGLISSWQDIQFIDEM